MRGEGFCRQGRGDARGKIGGRSCERRTVAANITRDQAFGWYSECRVQSQSIDDCHKQGRHHRDRDLGLNCLPATMASQHYRAIDGGTVLTAGTPCYCTDHCWLGEAEQGTMINGVVSAVAPPCTSRHFPPRPMIWPLVMLHF